MTKQQCTLAEPVEISGVGLFGGAPARVRCLPAEADSGVTFVRTDVDGRPRIRASIENVPGPERWTALRSGGVEVRMVEHLLAALCGLGIDNMVVEVDAAEMPAGDGSAQTYVEPLLRAGLRPLGVPRMRFDLPQPIMISLGDVALVAAPQDQGLTVTYILDYGRRFVGAQCLTFAVTEDSFVREIATARTFVLRPEVDAFIKQGLGKGATPENTLVLEEDGRTSSELRFPEECVRHKILDLLGDLFLVGAPLSARIVGYKSGHVANVLLAKAIREAMEKDQGSRMRHEG